MEHLALLLMVVTTLIILITSDLLQSRAMARVEAKIDVLLAALEADRDAY